MDSSSSQITKLGWELKSADPERHVKKIRGPLVGEQARLLLWRVFRVSWETR